MEHPRRVLVPGTGATGAEDRLPAVVDLRLNKKIAERRMQRIRGRRREDDLSVTRHLDLSLVRRAVGDRDPAQLDIILGRNTTSDVCTSMPRSLRRNSAIFSLGEDGLVALRDLQRGLPGGSDETAPLALSRI